MCGVAQVLSTERVDMVLEMNSAIGLQGTTGGAWEGSNHAVLLITRRHRHTAIIGALLVQILTTETLAFSTMTHWKSSVPNSHRPVHY